MRVLLVLPAYNEETALPSLFEAVRRELFQSRLGAAVVVVDDGSRDGTSRVIESWSARLPIHLVTHPVNQGLGATIRDGLERAAALAESGDVIVTMDADNTHSPALVRDMLARLEEGFDLVIASRYRPGAAVHGLSCFRNWMSRGARALFQIAAPMAGVRDYTSSFRAYRARLIQQALARYPGRLVTEGGFTCMAEILLKLRPLGVRASEVPLILRYDRKAGASKMKVGPTVARTLGLLVRGRLGRLA